jgi:hypothetical protein
LVYSLEDNPATQAHHKPMPSTDREERSVEVDAARLLLILFHFARAPDAAARALRCWPGRSVTRHFTPEYYLQKLDFLVRYPSYLAYELIELHALGIPSAADGVAVQGVIQQLVNDREPEYRTMPFRKFWRGAYESIDRVEAWWYARELVFIGMEQRGGAATPGRPQKHFFLTELGESTALRLVADVEHARWYDERIRLLHRFYSGLTPAAVKALQYSHPPYRLAQLNEHIPDLATEDVRANFQRVFGVTLETTND